MSRFPLEHGFELDVPADAVWRALTDLGAYPQWNRFIVEVAGGGEPSVGRVMALRVVFAPALKVVAHEEVLACERAEGKGHFTYAYRGLAYRMGGLRTLREHHVEPTPQGGCRYRSILRAEGLFRPLLPATWMGRLLEQSTQDLARRAQDLAG